MSGARARCFCAGSGPPLLLLASPVALGRTYASAGVGGHHVDLVGHQRGADLREQTGSIIGHDADGNDALR